MPDRDAALVGSSSGVCLIHGAFVGSACPTCSTSGNLPVQQSIGGGGFVFTSEFGDPQDPMIAGPKWREALNWIVGFCESHEQHHTGFTHIRRRAQAALGQDLGGIDQPPPPRPESRRPKPKPGEEEQDG